jgi:dihydrofolate reductase
VTLELIAAVGRSGQLGLDGRLPWNDPTDLRWFRHTTMGSAVLVGHKTYQTLPPLPGRHVIVDDTSRAPEDVLAQIERGHFTVFLAGGAKTYARYLHLVKRTHVALIDYDGPADVFMPPLWRT